MSDAIQGKQKSIDGVDKMKNKSVKKKVHKNKITWVQHLDIPHKATPLKIGKKMIDIDNEILPFIKILNECGLKTLSSCQGFPSRWNNSAFILFDITKMRDWRYVPNYQDSYLHPAMPVLVIYTEKLLFSSELIKEFSKNKLPLIEYDSNHITINAKNFTEISNHRKNGVVIRWKRK